MHPAHGAPPAPRAIRLADVPGDARGTPQGDTPTQAMIVQPLVCDFDRSTCRRPCAGSYTRE